MILCICYIYTVLIIILVDQEEDEGHKRHNEVRDANDGVGGALANVTPFLYSIS